MTDFVLALAVVFIAAGIMLLVGNQLGWPPVPLYILAGLIAGGFIQEGILIDLALWGIAFLVFVFGIRVDIQDITTVMRDGEIAALTQLVVVAPIAFGIGYMLGELAGFGDPVRNAIYFSATATLSSTIIGANVLASDIRNNLVYARLASSIHFFDDIVAIGALLILSADVLTDAQLITSKIGYGVIFILVGLLVYRHGYPVLVRAADGGAELILMGSISLLIAFMAAAEFVGISIVVGAFAAGLSIRREGTEMLSVQNGIESITDFFAAIFFVTIGALVTLPTTEVLALGIALVILVLAVNPLIHTVAFVLEGYDGRTAFLAGSSLNQVSEFALVIAIQALILGTIEPALFDAIILAAAVTMVLSTVLHAHEQSFYASVFDPLLGRWTGYIDDHSNVAEDLSGHVVIVGYGRQGRRLVERLESLDRTYVVLENDPLLRKEVEANCQQYVFGDAIGRYPLEQAGVETAELIISTVDHRPVSAALLDASTNADIILRADSSEEAAELLDLGATFVIVPSVLSADNLLQCLDRVLEDESAIESLRSNHRRFLSEVEQVDRTTRSPR